MGVVRVKDGVQFAVIAPGGFRILRAFDLCAEQRDEDLTITSGTDGEHSGPDDPHHHGAAFDGRTHGLRDKQATLDTIMENLDSRYFFGFIENPGLDTEHIHVQVRKGMAYPPSDGPVAVLDANDL